MAITLFSGVCTNPCVYQNSDWPDEKEQKDVLSTFDCQYYSLLSLLPRLVEAHHQEIDALKKENQDLRGNLQVTNNGTLVSNDCGPSHVNICQKCQEDKFEEFDKSSVPGDRDAVDSISDCLDIRENNVELISDGRRGIRVRKESDRMHIELKESWQEIFPENEQSLNTLYEGRWLSLDEKVSLTSVQLREQIGDSLHRHFFWRKDMKFVISPNNMPRLSWDTFGLVLICYDVIIVPYRWAFEPVISTFLFGMDVLTLAFWTMDMVQGFFLGFYEHGRYVDDNCQILRHYFKKDFFIDCIVVAPEWSIIAFQSYGTTESVSELGKLLKGARAVRAFRVMRLLKFRKIVGKMYDCIQYEYTFVMVALCELLGLIVACNHVIACVWYSVGIHYRDANERNWIDRHHLMEHDVKYRYATALHWSLTQFTPAGMGMSATNFGERVFSIVVLIVAMVGFSSIVGSITGFMTLLRRTAADDNKQMWLMRLFMKQNKVNLELRSRIQKYIDHQNRVKRSRVERGVLTCLNGLSVELRTELTRQVHSHYLTMHPFFHELNHSVEIIMRNICVSALHEQMHGDDEFIFHATELGKFMFFLRAGHLQYTTFDKQTLDPPVQIGETISEASVWADWRHQGTLITRAPSEILSLDPGIFRELMFVHPHPWSMAVNYAKHFISFLNKVDDQRFMDFIRDNDFFAEAVGAHPAWQQDLHHCIAKKL